jgi:phosphopantetheinyl transferase
MAALRCCAVNIDEWAPDDTEWRHALALVQPGERQRITSLHSRLVAKRTLVGRLLARLMIQQDLGITNQQINLGRTPEGKPFLKNLRRPSAGGRSGGGAESDGAGGSSIGNHDGGQSPPDSDPSRNGSAIRFAFNVSHHGAWAVVASLRPCRLSGTAPPAPPATLLVGVDVVKYEFRRGFASAEAFFASLSDSFTEAEWEHIHGCSSASARTPSSAPRPLVEAMPGLASSESPRTSLTSEALSEVGTADDFAKLQRLYHRWAVKEAYTKALGVGLAFGFGRVECLSDTAESTTPNVAVDGEQLGPNWVFFTLSLDRLHHVVVCAGAPSSGVIGHIADDTAEAMSWCPRMKLQQVSCRQLLSELQPCGERLCPTTPLESLR